VRQQAAATVQRRALLLALALATLGGCAAPAQPNHIDSQASYLRTFELATAAMADQRMIFDVIDRRQGRAVATLNGDTITATLQDQLDGTVRVTFNAQGQADPDLLKRVIASFNGRMGKLGMLGGFKDSGGAEYKGPIPCASGPAFCP
jgi:hypothetical protein